MAFSWRSGPDLPRATSARIPASARRAALRQHEEGALLQLRRRGAVQHLFEQRHRPLRLGVHQAVDRHQLQVLVVARGLPQHRPARGGPDLELQGARLLAPRALREPGRELPEDREGFVPAPLLVARVGQPVERPVRAAPARLDDLLKGVGGRVPVAGVERGRPAFVELGVFGGGFLFGPAAREKNDFVEAPRRDRHGRGGGDREEDETGAEAGDASRHTRFLSGVAGAEEAARSRSRDPRIRTLNRTPSASIRRASASRSAAESFDGPCRTSRRMRSSSSKTPETPASPFRVAAWR